MFQCLFLRVFKKRSGYMLLLFAFLSVLACGGGGGGGSDGGGAQINAPVISNLTYSPQTAEAGNYDIKVTGNFDFTSQSDVVTLALTDSRGNDYSIPITGATGIRAGRITVPETNLSADTAGLYVFNIWLVDSHSRKSNQISGTIDVYLTADAGDDLIVNTGTDVFLNGTGSPITGPLYYHWELIQKPTNSHVEFDDSMAADRNFVPDFDGVYVIQLTVSDGENFSDPDIINITSMPAGYYTLGSHKDDVAAIQGTPVRISSGGSYWYYGSLTHVRFSTQDDTVMSWDNRDGSLKVQM